MVPLIYSFLSKILQEKQNNLCYMGKIVANYMPQLVRIQNNPLGIVDQSVKNGEKNKNEILNKTLDFGG